MTLEENGLAEAEEGAREGEGEIDTSLKSLLQKSLQARYLSISFNSSICS